MTTDEVRTVKIQRLVESMVRRLGYTPDAGREAELRSKAERLLDEVEARVRGEKSGPLPPDCVHTRMRSEMRSDAETTALNHAVDELR